MVGIHQRSGKSGVTVKMAKAGISNLVIPKWGEWNREMDMGLDDKQLILAYDREMKILSDSNAGATCTQNQSIANIDIEYATFDALLEELDDM